MGRKKDAVTELTTAQKEQLIFQSKLSQQQLQNQLERYVEDQSYALQNLSDELATLNDKYTSDSPLKQHAASVRSIDSEYRGLNRSLKNSFKTLSENKKRFEETANNLTQLIPGLEQLKQQYLSVGDTKYASALSTTIDYFSNQLAILLEKIPEMEIQIKQYEAQIKKLPDIMNRAYEREDVLDGIRIRESELQIDRTLTESDNSLLDAGATSLQNSGDEFGANRLLKQKAIAEENLRYREYLLNLDKQIAENPTNYTADAVARLKQNAEALNTVNLQNINRQFKDLGQVIEGEVQGALTGFFEDIFTNTKSVGEAFRDMALNILKSIARIAAQQVVLNIFGKANGAKDGFRGLFGKLLGHADGGLVTGEGTGTSDSIVRRLSNGEFVVKAAAVQHWGTDFLHDLNAMRQPSMTFAASSISNSGNSRAVSNPTITVNVSTPDANSFRKSETQIGRDAGEQYRRAIYRNS